MARCDKSQTDISLSKIGLKIKEVRESKKLSLQEVCDLAGGMSHTTLSKIENGINNPSNRSLIALAKALNSNFGNPDLDKSLIGNISAPSKKEIAEKMTVKEFVSLKFDIKKTRRSKSELDMLTKLLDAEIERMKDEEEKYGG